MARLHATVNTSPLAAALLALEGCSNKTCNPIEKPVADPIPDEEADSGHALLEPAPLGPDRGVLQIHGYICARRFCALLNDRLKIDVLPVAKPLQNLLRYETVGQDIEPSLIVNNISSVTDHLAQMPTGNIQQKTAVIRMVLVC